jgi:hypothetical protein
MLYAGATSNPGGGGEGSENFRQDSSLSKQLQFIVELIACCAPQEFGPTGKEGKLMLPHPAGNDKGRNILQVKTTASKGHSSWQLPVIHQLAAVLVSGTAV